MVAIISITFIILSTVVLTLNTLPYFSHSDENKHEKDYPPFALLEAIYMSWFSFEFLVRLFNIYGRHKPITIVRVLFLLVGFSVTEEKL